MRAVAVIVFVAACLLGDVVLGQLLDDPDLYRDLSEGRVEQLDMYLSSGGNPNAEIRQPRTGNVIDMLELAIRAPNESAALRLLRAGARPESGAQMIKPAGQVGLWDAVFLLAEGDPLRLYDVPPGDHPLLYAIVAERSDVAERLIGLLDWETQDDARAALTRAVQVAANLYRDKRLIQKLIDAGAYVNAEPVLVIATAHCEAELVGVLLRAGVDPAQAYRDQSR